METAALTHLLMTRNKFPKQQKGKLDEILATRVRTCHAEAGGGGEVRDDSLFSLTY
jgi:hypothetical protein